MYRAWAMGFTMLRFGGEGSERISTPSAERAKNYDPYGVEANWRFTESWNKILSYSNLFNGNLKANEEKEWGKARLVKNFSEEVIL